MMVSDETVQILGYIGAGLLYTLAACRWWARWRDRHHLRDPRRRTWWRAGMAQLEKTHVELVRRRR